MRLSWLRRGPIERCAAAAAAAAAADADGPAEFPSCWPPSHSGSSDTKRLQQQIYSQLTF